VGGSITEAWAGFFSSPLARRREAWLAQLAMAVAELLKNPGTTLESLQRNEAFVSAVLAATSIAVRTHQTEKLAALRNGTISSVLNTDISEDEQSLFMRYVDEFSPWHFRVLRAFHDPNGHLQARGVTKPWLVESGGTLWSSSKHIRTFMGQAFPELQSEHQFVGLVLHDLGVRQLIPVQQMFHQSLPDIGPYTTITGRKFIRFIGGEAISGSSAAKNFQEHSAALRLAEIHG
jgi:hypothetical protein